MFFPILDILLTKLPLALIKMPDGNVVIRALKPISSKFFVTRINKHSGGVFAIDKTKAMIWTEGMGTKLIYLYDARSMNPLDIKIMNELMKFKEANKFTKITKLTKYLGHLLKVYLKTLPEEQRSKFSSIKAEELVKKLTPEDTEVEKVAKNKIIGLLKEQGIIDIAYPLSDELSSYFEDFKNVEPDFIFNFLMSAQQTDFEHKKLQSKKIQGNLQILLVIGILLAIMLGAVFLIPDDLNFGNILPSFDLGF